MSRLWVTKTSSGSIPGLVVFRPCEPQLHRVVFFREATLRAHPFRGVFALEMLGSAMCSDDQADVQVDAELKV